jgi:cell division protein FtsA
MANDIRSEPHSDNIVVGLDLGTTKTVCLIAEVGPQGRINVVGVGKAPSSGLRKGVVVNIDGTVEAINRALHEAERMAGVEVDSLFVSVGGDHIKGLTSHGVIAVSRKDREIGADDVERVIEAAKAIPIPQDREILHVLTQEYLIDNQDGIRDPIGMSGVRLESVVHVVTGAVTSVQNILKSLERAGARVEDIILQSLASAEAVLTADEKELGVCLVDIGGGTTDLMLYWEGAIRYTSVLPVGGNQLTKDLAFGLRTPNEEAEKIKKEHGCVLASLVGEDEQIAVAGVGGREERPTPRRQGVEILQPRMEEILGLINADLAKSGFGGKLAAGVVLTGGCAQSQGLLPLAEKVLGQQVRIGKPMAMSGLGDVVNSPEYAAAVGLVAYGSRLRSEGGGDGKAPGPVGPGIFEKLQQWIIESF